MTLTKLQRVVEKDMQHVADTLIKRYIGPDRKITNMRTFSGALVQALQSAHRQGWNDHAEKIFGRSLG
jgi:hypothetical protein